MPEELLDPDKAAEPDGDVRCDRLLIGVDDIFLTFPQRYCGNEMELATSPTCAPEGHTYCPDHTSELVQALRCCSEACAIREAERLQRRAPQPPRRPQLPAGRKA